MTGEDLNRSLFPPRRILSLLVPPLCPGCGRALDPHLTLCGGCLRELNRVPVLRTDPPPGVSATVSCAPHEGTARRILAAWKFRGATGLEDLIGGYMADLAGPATPGLLVVPIPSSPLRRRLRGFDPVAPLAERIGRELDETEPGAGCLIRRGSGRQRGRGRSGRLDDPPDIRPAPHAPELDGRPVLLVDDVLTTGATLAVAAASVRKLGAGTVRAITFTRRL